jgi:hypothetical protein
MKEFHNLVRRKYEGISDEIFYQNTLEGQRKIVRPH